MRSQLRGALSSADQTQLNAILQSFGSLSGVLSDERDFVGTLTSEIQMASALQVTASLVAGFSSSDPAASLSVVATLTGALSTGIPLQASLGAQYTLAARLTVQPSGEFVAQPGEVYTVVLTKGANGIQVSQSANNVQASIAVDAPGAAEAAFAYALLLLKRPEDEES
jgi:hypothetical protein